MKQDTIAWLKTRKGKLIGIGIEEDAFIDAILQNKELENCELLNSILVDNKKQEKGGKKKTLSLRKLKRHFKKKKHQAMLVNYSHVSHYLKTFIRDSIDIIDGEIYFYHLTEEEVEKLNTRYQRYHISSIVKQYQKEYTLKLEVGKKRTHWVSNLIYFIIDSISNGIELFTEFLIH